MKKRKLVSIVFAFVLSSTLCVTGVSAANLSSTNVSTKTAIETTAESNITSIYKISNKDRAIFKQYYQAALNSIASKSISSDSIIKPEFNYGPTSGPELDEIVFNEGGVVQRGDVGLAVQQLQEYINYVFWTSIAQDGYFGDDTYAGVVAFQKWWNNNRNSYKLSVDGIVGSQTLTALETVLKGN